MVFNQLKFYGAVTALTVVGACANEEPTTPALFSDDLIASVTAAQSAPSAAERIEADVVYLADDARGGREAGTKGYDAAADYVAARMADLGLAPGADGGWFQEVPLIASQAVVDDAALTITGPDGEATAFENLGDFRLYTSIGADNFDIENAPAVFIGHGVHAPDYGHDDLEGLDLNGKVVVYFSGAPDTFQSEQRAHFGNGKAKAWSERGAVGALAVRSEGDTSRNPWERLIQNPNSISMTWLWPDGRAEQSGPNIKGSGSINPDISEALFAGAPKTFAEVRAEADAAGVAPTGFDLGVRISMKGAATRTEKQSSNVVGVIEGSDPELRDEYVVLTAHLDGVGTNQNLVDEGEDGINNGALDNALGIATMLEAASRLVENPPARSVIFLAVTAEEKGLLGADYYAHFPTMPLDSLVANVNLDMPLVLHSFTDVIAFGAERSSLGPIVAQAAEQAGVKLSPDPMPEQGIFTRSDHYRFVEKGVPAVFMIVGFENGGAEKFQTFITTNYHQPGDDVSQAILYDDAARFADVNVEIAIAIANTPIRPSWNEGDFFGELFAGE